MSSFQPEHDKGSIPKFRILCMAGVAALMFSTLVARLYYLQIIEHQKYLKVANQNRIDIRPVKAKRGLIFDRNGILIADNQPSFTLMVTPENIKDPNKARNILAKAIQLTPDQQLRFDKMDTIPRRPFEPLHLKDRLTNEEIAAVVVNQHLLPGINIDAQLRRHYPFKETTAHILGFVGQISEEDRENLPNNANNTGITHIGKKGIELAYEQTLRGAAGHAYVETNARGRNIRTLEESPPTAGMDLKLTIDIHLQTATYNALKQFKKASAVAINPQNGEILAIVSMPSYDPNEFVSGISQKKYNRLRRNSARPLFNRAVQGQYPPGSTIKPMVALTGLALGATTWNTSIWDPGYYQLKKHPRRYRDWKRWGHGSVNLARAIIESCDTFFYDMGSRIQIDELSLGMNIFGFGRPTGIDLTGEAAGLFPTTEWKSRKIGQPWFPGETLIAMIGQGYVLATPLQLAYGTAMLASKGNTPKPHLVAHTRVHNSNSQWIENDLELSNFQSKSTTLNKNTLFQEQYWSPMIDAMRKVVSSTKGTGHKIAKNLSYSIAGKTGTAQVVAIHKDKQYDPDSLSEDNLDHALFIGFAPIESPQIAIAVIIENGGGGGSVAAPVARTILDAHLAKPEPAASQATTLPKPTLPKPTLPQTADPKLLEPKKEI